MRGLAGHAMMASMDVLDTKTSSAAENMRIDEQLLSELDPKGEPILHLYRWDGRSATYGHFIDPAEWFHLDRAASNKLSLGKRPTGGGIVFHIWDLAFSFLMPASHKAFSLNTLSNYQFVNEVVLEAVKEFFHLESAPTIIPVDFEAKSFDCSRFCMAKPTQYDVVFQGMKIAGAAQRRRRQGYLHQGTISLGFPDENLLRDVLRSNEDVIEAMTLYTFSPLGKDFSLQHLEEVRKSLEESLQQKFLEKLQRFL